MKKKITFIVENIWFNWVIKKITYYATKKSFFFFKVVYLYAYGISYGSNLISDILSFRTLILMNFNLSQSYWSCNWLIFIVIGETIFTR